MKYDKIQLSPPENGTLFNKTLPSIDSKIEKDELAAFFIENAAVAFFSDYCHCYIHSEHRQTLLTCLDVTQPCDGGRVVEITRTRVLEVHNAVL